MTLLNRDKRAVAAVACRLGRFRHELNGLGDHPTEVKLQEVLDRARDLNLRDEEIAEELSQIHAMLEALAFGRSLIETGLPVVSTTETMAPGDCCHFFTAVRHGRRRSDQCGHLLLTSGWLKFRSLIAMTVAWGEVAEVQRIGTELVVSLHERRRTLRFSCQNVTEAARASVLAQHLVRLAAPPPLIVAEPGAPYLAAL